MSSEHTSGVELAELDAGTVDPARQAAVAEHVAGCPACAGRSSDIRDVGTALASAGPLPMPPDVAQRLHTRLQAAGEETGTAGATVVPAAPPRHRLTGASVASMAAGFIVIAAIAAVIVGHHRSNGPGSASASSAAAGAQNQPLVHSQPQQFHYLSFATGRDYTPGTVGALAPKLLHSASSSDSLDASPQPVATGAEKSRGSANAPAAASDLPTTARIPRALRRLHDSRSALLNCAAAVTGQPNAVPLAVDFARWTNGTAHRVPAVVFVFDATPTRDAIWVSGPSCQGTDAVLDFVEVPKP